MRVVKIEDQTALGRSKAFFEYLGGIRDGLLVGLSLLYFLGYLS